MKSLILLLLLACALLLASSGSSAQEGTAGSVRGTIVDDSTKNGLEFANILLLRKIDSVLVTGTVSEPGGKFEFKNVRAGEYIAKFSLLGYEEKTSSPFLIDSLHRKLIFGAVSLVPASLNLEEVTVTAQRPQLEQLVDRMVYHVDQDIAGKTSSASELLENIPSVQVDLDGQVSLRGSKRVLMMINGKRSPVLEKKEGTFLEELPANSIDRVEVITTPSARYRAEGKSGIINIVLKKDTPLGTHGTVTAHLGSSGRYNVGARLNVNPGGVNFFGSYTVRRDNKDHRTSDVRDIPSSTNPPLSSEYSDSLFAYSTPVTQLVSLGIDYRLDEMNSMGVSDNYFQNSFDRTDFSARVLRDTRNIPITVYDRDDSGYDFDKENTIGANYQHTFGRMDHKLRVEFTSSGSPETDEYRFKNTYLSPPFPSAFDNTRNSQRDDKSQLAVDYSDAIDSRSSVEAGYTLESNRTVLDFYAENFDAIQNQFVVEPAKTSSYHYTESLNSGYVTYKQSFGKLGVLGGMRIERESQTSNLVTLDSSITHSYANVFPSLHLSYSFGKGRMLKVSYSRRISRPKPRELNPFAEYRDPRSTSFGNPDLLPEYVHSLELGYQIHAGKFFIHPSLFYRSSTNSIAPLKALVNRSTLVTTRHNVASDHSVGLEIIGSLDIGDVFSTHVSATGFYEELDATNLGQGLFKSDVTWNGTMTCNVKIAKGSRFELHSHVNSLKLTPQGKYFPSFTINVGFRQEMLDGKLFFTATATDLFQTLVRHFELDIPGLQQVVYTSRESRIVFLGLSYRFGNVLQKSEEDEFHYDED